MHFIGSGYGSALLSWSCQGLAAAYEIQFQILDNQDKANNKIGKKSTQELKTLAWTDG